MSNEITVFEALRGQRSEFGNEGDKTRFERAVIESNGLVHTVRLHFKRLGRGEANVTTWSTTEEEGVFSTSSTSGGGDEAPVAADRIHLLGALGFLKDKLKPDHLQRIKAHMGVAKKTRAALGRELR